MSTDLSIEDIDRLMAERGMGVSPSAPSTSKAATAHGGEWGEPEELVAGVPDDLPSFPLDVLPDWMAAMAETSSAVQCVPPDCSALLQLAVASAGTSGRVRINLTSQTEGADGWREPLNLYVVVGQESGTGKSGLHRHAVGPLRQLEREMKEAAKPATARARAQFEVLSGRLAALKTQSKKVEVDDDELARLTDEMVRLELEMAQLPPMEGPQLIVDDSGTEMIGSILAANGGHLGVFAEEGGTFGHLQGRYKSNGDSNIDIWLSGHDGGSVRVNRFNRKVDLDEVYMSVGLTVQPQTLVKVGSDENLMERGFVARFLMAQPFIDIGNRDLEHAPPVDAAVLGEYNRRMGALLRSFIADPNFGVGDELVLTPEAADRMNRLRGEIERDRRPGCRLHGMGGWAGKAAGQTGRLAGLLHVLHSFDGAGGYSQPVPLERVEDAIRILEYLIPHAAAVFASIRMGTGLSDAQDVLRWLRQRGEQVVSQSDVRDSLKSKLDGERVSSAFMVLREHGWVQAVELEKRRGRPSPKWRVHPSLVSGR